MSKIERMIKIEFDGNAENYNTEKNVSIDSDGWIVISNELDVALCFSPNQVKKLISILQSYTERANIPDNQANGGSNPPSPTKYRYNQKAKKDE